MKIPKKLFVIFGLFFMFYDDGAMAMQLSSRVSPISSQSSSLSSLCEQETQSEVQRVATEKIEVCASVHNQEEVFAQPNLDDLISFPTDNAHVAFKNDLKSVGKTAKRHPQIVAFNLAALCKLLVEPSTGKQAAVKQQAEKRRLQESKSN